MSRDLSDTLLVIPCCASKKGADEVDLQSVLIADMLNESAVHVLSEGRTASWRIAHVDEESPQRKALSYYTGMPYGYPGFRPALVEAIQRGLHCLIVSGGYGVLRAEEPIHRYEAHLPKTMSVWRRRVPSILQDYVARNGIRRSFGSFSRSYGAVVPPTLTKEDWRSVPEFTRGVDHGSPMREVPRRVGEAVTVLLSADLVPDSRWCRSHG